jgi:polyhydroxyalkanoate synthesis regulator phasin
MFKKRGLVLLLLSITMGVGAAWVANNWVQQRGELAAEEGLRLRDKLVRPGEGSPGSRWPREADLERVLDERGVPSQQDLQQILAQLEALASKLEEMGPEQDSEPAKEESVHPPP